MNDMKKGIQIMNAEEPDASEFLREMFAIQDERRATVQPAREALDRLVQMMAHRSGTSGRMRALLYSLWNGKPAPLNNVLGLDWGNRKDFCAVVLAFGCDEFFYDAIEEAVTKAGLWEWFLEERYKVVEG
jgi:hypothetical protein